MAQRVQELATRPDNLNSIIRTHMLERFNFLNESFDRQMCAKE